MEAIHLESPRFGRTGAGLLPCMRTNQDEAEAEAFPDERACAVEHYRPPMGRLGDFVRAVVLVACCIAIPWLAAQGLN
jgi:hypothetical protein